MGAIGPTQTDTLFAHLPPSGWGDVATKRDLENLRLLLHGEIAELRGEITGIKAELRLLRWMVGLLVVLMAAVLGTLTFQ